MCNDPRPSGGGVRSPGREAARSIEVSDDQKGPDKGFGRKKPRATFGDAMLGIPAGRGGEQGERPKGERRREKPASAAAGETPPADPPRREPRKPERRKPQGPLVVVRKASGAIETRGPESPRVEEPAAAAVQASVVPSTEPTAPATPPPARSALYEE